MLDKIENWIVAITKEYLYWLPFDILVDIVRLYANIYNKTKDERTLETIQCFCEFSPILPYWMEAKADLEGGW